MYICFAYVDELVANIAAMTLQEEEPSIIESSLGEDFAEEIAAVSSSTESSTEDGGDEPKDKNVKRITTVSSMAASFVNKANTI